MRNRDRWSLPQGLYRDRENGWLFGVCAGLADRFELNPLGVRLVAIAAGILFSWLAVAVYLVAAFVIREKPLIYAGSREEYEFWRRYRDGAWRE